MFHQCSINSNSFCTFVLDNYKKNIQWQKNTF
jgi:hypothetical protein